MKITKFLGLSFFLCAFIATSFPEAVHAEDAAAVLDLFDHEMLFDARYKIISTSTDNTTLAVTESGIFVELSKENEGLPVTFSPPTKSSDSVIREGNYLTVSFDSAVTTTWMIQLSPTTGGLVVTTEGVDRLNRFKITKSEDHDRVYQLSFCPMCELWCTCPCVPVGVNGTDKNLVPNAGPLLVKFERI